MCLIGRNTQGRRFFYEHSDADLFRGTAVGGRGILYCAEAGQVDRAFGIQSAVLSADQYISDRISSGDGAERVLGGAVCAASRAGRSGAKGG